ncbi:MAG TPA: ABC transporter permease [Kiritimatiellia bacterium]|jgi:ABC-2 type transport system permease protein
MSSFLTLWRKELASYFYSPIAYVVTIFFLAVMGVVFWMLASALVDAPAGVSVMNLLFATPFFWMIMLVIVPVLTMRLIAEEKRSGTFETLLTAPVSDLSVVMAKYFGAVSFYVMLWLPTVAYVFILRRFSSVMAPIDFGPMMGGYLGAFLVGLFFISVGLFCSALTSNQIVAAIMAFALIGGLFFAGLFQYVSHNELVKACSIYVSSYTHMYDFSRGAIDTRPVVLYLSGAMFMLFATVKVVESRKWK